MDCLRHPTNDLIEQLRNSNTAAFATDNGAEMIAVMPALMMRLMFCLGLASVALALPSPKPHTDPKAVYVPLHFHSNNYHVNVSVGTPPQEVLMMVDTGSDANWVHGPKANRVSKVYGGIFDPSVSESYTLLNSTGFKVAYGDWTEVHGDWFSDSLRMGSGVLENLAMGLADKRIASNEPGLMGLSPPFPVGITDNYIAPNGRIVDLMAQQGIIQTRSFSLSLGRSDQNSSSILFGAHDP
ncbi:hypothetical protein LTR53_017436, partial [Teratosphaeriaceae sp. CCFEE 6253]